MPTTFYLIRHGIKEKTDGDAGLTPAGFLQAKETAMFFREKPITAVYASPLRRAKETAACIASEYGLPVLDDSRLRERANWGDLPGQTFEHFIAMWERCTLERDYVPPIGDSARQAGERLELFVREMAGKHPDSEIVAVTHGGLITDFLINVCSEAELQRCHPNFIAVQSTLISECSVTELRFDGHRYELKRFAELIGPIN